MNAEVPRVSVVIPVFNRRGPLEQCLNALRAQTMRGFEVIVVDDGSQDGTAEFLADFAKEEVPFQFHWIINEVNMGSNPSRNRAIARARGAFVAFLDSDCIPPPEWLMRLLSGFSDERVGAVAGRVVDHQSRNLFELTLKGMNRVHGDGDAPRLIGCNMCVRRELLARFPLDEDLRFGCDEEGIYLRLKAAGYRQLILPDAIVHHEHPYQARSFFRSAWVGGKAAGWLVYKFRLWPRLDLAPLILGYLLLALSLLHPYFLIAAGACFALQLAALLYNDIFRKGKSVIASIITLPLLFAYYQVRLAGYLWYSIGVRINPGTIERVDWDAIKKSSYAPAPPGNERSSQQVS